MSRIPITITIPPDLLPKLDELVRERIDSGRQRSAFLEMVIRDLWAAKVERDREEKAARRVKR